MHTRVQTHSKRDSLLDSIILAPVVVPRIALKTACILGLVILSFIQQALDRMSKKIAKAKNSNFDLTC